MTIQPGKQRDYSIEGANTPAFVADAHKSRKKLIIIVGVVLLLVVGLIGFVIFNLMATGGLWHKNEPPKVPAAVVVNLPPITDAQRHAINAVVHVAGIIVSFTDSSVTVMVTDQAKPVVFQTDKTTHYLQGNHGFSSNRTALKAGHSVVLVYNKDSKKALSVWVDYDAK